MKMAILLVWPPSKMLDGRVDGSIGYPLDSYDCYSNWGAKKQDIFFAYDVAFICRVLSHS